MTSMAPPQEAPQSAARPPHDDDSRQKRQHHLLKHHVTPDVAHTARKLLVGTDTPEEGAAALFTLQQKELRQAFEKVYGVPTASCNNGWMRGKLLQALGFDAHWQPPRDELPGAAGGSIAAAEAPPGSEHSRFGRRVRRRKYEGSDGEGGADSEAASAGSPRAAVSGGSGGRPPAAKRRSPCGTPAAAHGSSAAVRCAPPVTSGATWQAVPSGVVHPWLVQHAAGPAALQQVRIMVRQPSSKPDGQDGPEVLVMGPSAPVEPPPRPASTPLPGTAPGLGQMPPGVAALPGSGPPSRAASPPQHTHYWIQAGQPQAHAAPVPHQHPQHQQPMAAVLGAGGATRGGPSAPHFDAASLLFYEQQQQLFLLKRQQVEMEKQRDSDLELRRQQHEAVQRARLRQALTAAVQHAAHEAQQQQQQAQARAYAACMPLPAVPSPPTQLGPPTSQPLYRVPSPAPFAGGQPAAMPGQVPGAFLRNPAALMLQAQQQPGMAFAVEASPFAGEAGVALPAAPPLRAAPQPAPAAALPFYGAGYLPMPLPSAMTVSQELHGLYGAWAEGQLSLSLSLQEAIRGS